MPKIVQDGIDYYLYYNVLAGKCLRPHIRLPHRDVTLNRSRYLLILFQSVTATGARPREGDPRPVRGHDAGVLGRAPAGPRARSGRARFRHYDTHSCALLDYTGF